MDCYVFVRFMDEHSKILDLIPCSWLRNDYSCFYPNACDYQNMENWLVSLKEPEEHWKYFSITIITYASKKLYL